MAVALLDVNVIFALADDIQVTEMIQAYTSPALRGHLQIADAYLLSLAIAHGGKLATFDRRAASLTQASATGSVEIISVLS